GRARRPNRRASLGAQASSKTPAPVKDIRWTNQAILALASLTGRERQVLLDRLELVGQFPAMYPARQRGRFASLRYFVLSNRWVVYYRPKEEGDLLIFAIVPARARPH